MSESAQSSEDWTERYGRAYLGVYGPPQRALVRGQGAEVWDAEGRRYLDLLGGIAVNALGHAHPRLVDAVATQLATLGHVSGFFTTPAQVLLAERLLGLVVPGGAPEGSRVFLTNSGTEAVEAAFKLARRHGGPGGRILALEGAFHGRTMGALALTHKSAYREPFAPLPGVVEHLPFGDTAALEAAMADDVAALFLEPIQGEAGVRPLPPGYLARARELTARHDALLVLDEIQSGIGRTGTWLASHLEHLGSGIVPDVVTLAKGLGGGIPIGAMVTIGERVSGLLEKGQHGTTFGGNPVAATAALTTLEVLEEEDVLAAVTERGKQLRAGIEALGHPLVDSVRGEGLLLAAVLRRPVAAAVVTAGLEAGFLLNAVAPDAIRLAPPLVLSREQVEEFLDALPRILDAAEGAA